MSLAAPGARAERGSTRALEAYFFFDFLAFFAFFAFFAFLAIVSSQGLMDGNATRGMLGGGPASQHPQLQSQQIRGALPRTVTWLLLRYPQLLCVFERFSPPSGARCRKNPNSRANDRTSWPLGRLNDALARARILYRSGTERAIFINSKP